MTRGEAIYCMKANSILHSEICEECPLYGDTGVDHCFEDALDEAIKALEQDGKFNPWDLTTPDAPLGYRWVPVSQGLPENETYILTTIKVSHRQAHVRSGFFMDGLFHNDNGDTWNASDREVKAWMPLPDPYTGER